MNAGSRFLHRLLALALCAAAPAAHPQSRATITIDPGVQASSGIETQVLAAEIGRASCWETFYM